jgi:hypothetical protein
MNDPLPLQDLPEYLKNHHNGDPNGSPVIGMGQIVAPKTNWLRNLSLATAACVVLGLGGIAAYNLISPKEVTVVIAANDANPDFIVGIVSVGGGKVMSVTQTETDTYEVKLSLRRNVNSFLDWLRKNKDVKRVELEE